MKKVYLISGKINSGKNKFADFLKAEYEALGLVVEMDLFAGDLKRYAKEDFKLLADYLNSLDYPELKISNDNWYEYKTPLTRIILQIYGTETFRNRVRDSYWVDLVRERCEKSNADIILITDVRFPNEIDSMCSGEFSDIVIRINRDLKRDQQLDQHSSETALDNYPYWHYTIDNNGTLEDLEANAKILVGESMDIGEKDAAI